MPQSTAKLTKPKIERVIQNGEEVFAVTLQVEDPIPPDQLTAAILLPTRSPLRRPKPQ